MAHRLAEGLKGITLSISLGGFMATAQAPTSEQTQEQESQKVEKGAQHPTQNLESAVADLETLQKAIGFSVVARDMGIRAWGYSSLSGRASTRLGAQSHFGL